MAREAASCSSFRRRRWDRRARRRARERAERPTTHPRKEKRTLGALGKNAPNERDPRAPPRGSLFFARGLRFARPLGATLRWPEASADRGQGDPERALLRVEQDLVRVDRPDDGVEQA